MNVGCARCDGGDPNCTACADHNAMMRGQDPLLIKKENDMSRKTKHTKSRRRRKVGSKKRRQKKKAKKQS